MSAAGDVLARRVDLARAAAFLVSPRHRNRGPLDRARMLDCPKAWVSTGAETAAAAARRQSVGGVAATDALVMYTVATGMDRSG